MLFLGAYYLPILILKPASISDEVQDGCEKIIYRLKNDLGD